MSEITERIVSEIRENLANDPDPDNPYRGKSDEYVLARSMMTLSDQEIASLRPEETSQVLAANLAKNLNYSQTLALMSLVCARIFAGFREFDEEDVDLATTGFGEMVCEIACEMMADDRENEEKEDGDDSESVSEHTGETEPGH